MVVVVVVIVVVVVVDVVVVVVVVVVLGMHAPRPGPVGAVPLAVVRSFRGVAFERVFGSTLVIGYWSLVIGYLSV